MAPQTAAATLADLHKVEGKAELIGGRIVELMATGSRPALIGGRIYQALDAYALTVGRGVAYPDNAGFAVPELSSGRETFSPDAAYYVGALPADDMDFVPGAPLLAVEVRSKNDYGPAAEAEMAAKRFDYFEAGTRVVWDVDPRANVVRVYEAASPDAPAEYGPGTEARAEAAMPGWRLAVDSVMG